MYYRDQAKLYYLYMMADGEVSEKEKKIFTDICKEIGIDSDDKKYVVSECKSYEKDHKNCISILKASKDSGVFGSDISLSEYENNKDKAAVLWNLINLGYADKDFSKAEKEIVDFLRDYWDIEDELYNEMIDVAETMLELEEHRRWVEDNIPDSEDKYAKIRQIKKDIKSAHNSIITTISEIEK